MTKTQTLAVLTEAITKVVSNSDTLKKNMAGTLINQLMEEITPLVGPSSRTSKKINEEGLVYCNYFEYYFPADDFKTKSNGSYKSNSIYADQIIRKIKNLKIKVTSQLTKNMRDGTITHQEWLDGMDKLDQELGVKFNSLNDIPTVADLIGLEVGTGSNTDMRPERV